MARVNLERRAEIGLAKRTRTRAVILQAARTCYAAETAAPVTVDSVMQAAGLAKGTFYVHFRRPYGARGRAGRGADRGAGREPAAGASGGRSSADAPRHGVTILLRDLASAPARARLVGRVVSAVPDVGGAVQAHLREDLAEVSAAGLLAMRSVDLAARVVTALCELAARELGEERIDEKAIPDIVRAILRALGCPPREAAVRADQAARHADAFARRAAVPAGAPC